MIQEYIVLSVLVIVIVLNVVINKSKPSWIKSMIGLFLGLSYLLFLFIDLFKPYVWIFDLYTLVYTIYLSIFLVPKKITKNLTEYDYFEVENAYKDLKDEQEKLRERFLSTIGLIDEGVVFYENNYRQVFLSDKANQVFGGQPSRDFKDHAQSVYEDDRKDYVQTIEHLSKRSNEYKIKYRVVKDNLRLWVEERGNFINVSGKKSIIATIKLLDPVVFSETSYFELDSIYKEDRLYPILNSLISGHKKFSLIIFELTNIPEINKKYGREIGSLMMSDYIKFLKNSFQRDITKMFRISGIRFAMVIDNESDFEEFRKQLTAKSSALYNVRIKIAGINDTIKPNFGVLRFGVTKSINSRDIVSITEKTLDEAIDSSRKNFAIFGE